MSFGYRSIFFGIFVSPPFGISSLDCQLLHYGIYNATPTVGYMRQKENPRNSPHIISWILRSLTGLHSSLHHPESYLFCRQYMRFFALVIRRNRREIYLLHFVWNQNLPYFLLDFSYLLKAFIFSFCIHSLSWLINEKSVTLVELFLFLPPPLIFHLLSFDNRNNFQLFVYYKLYIIN